MLKYPVVCFKPNDTMVYGFKVSNDLLTADKGLVEKGVFKDIVIIDSTGFSFLVKKVRILGWATPFLGFSLKKPGRLVKIEINLERSSKISLDDLKIEFIKRIRSTPYFVQTFQVEELENSIKNADSYELLFENFG